MTSELRSAVTVPRKPRSPLLILGAVVISLVTLYLFLVIFGGMGWDGY
jgi:hypothetical protein